MDEKGRISIPSSIRKSFGLRRGSSLELFFDLKENIIFLLANGQDGVEGSTKACEALRPGSKAVFGLESSVLKTGGRKQKTAGFPGPDPFEKRRWKDDRKVF